MVNNSKRLGFSGKTDVEGLEKLVDELLKVMEDKKMDYTYTWRGLSDCDFGAENFATDEKPFSRALWGDEKVLPREFTEWLKKWKALAEKNNITLDRVTMKKTSPQLIPRNWMMMEAYRAAEGGDFSSVNELLEMFEDPYSDRPEDGKWMIRTPMYHRRLAEVRHMT